MRIARVAIQIKYIIMLSAFVQNWIHILSESRYVVALPEVSYIIACVRICGDDRVDRARASSMQIAIDI